MSPALKPWLDFVIEQTAELLTVAIVQEVNVVFKGVTSNSWPSKYISKNLSVPIAMYLFPSKSTKANWRLATPTIVSVTNEDQPPTFSGSPYLNLVLSQSIHLFSAPDAVSCLSIPGANLIWVRAVD